MPNKKKTSEKENKQDEHVEEVVNKDTSTEDTQSDVPEAVEIDIQAQQSGSAGPATASGSDQRILQLEAELKQAKDDKLRSIAELDNFRKRKEQEIQSYKKYAQEKFVLELLPIVDNLELACQHAETLDESTQKTFDGFMLIRKQFKSFFEKLGIERIECIDKPFDPNFHQAISQEAKDGVNPDTVIKEMQAGYTLHGRVIRPSMVVVSQ